MNNKEQLSGFIIAGGKSSRMGTDKATLLWNNKTFIQHIIDAFNSLRIDIKLVSSLQKHKNANIPIVEDIFKNAGPVAGIASALSETKTNINVIVSCDVPLILSLIHI